MPGLRGVAARRSGGGPEKLRNVTYTMIVVLLGRQKSTKRYVYNENAGFGGQQSTKRYEYNENYGFGAAAAAIAAAASQHVPT